MRLTRYWYVTSARHHTTNMLSGLTKYSLTHNTQKKKRKNTQNITNGMSQWNGSNTFGSRMAFCMVSRLACHWFKKGAFGTLIVLIPSALRFVIERSEPNEHEMSIVHVSSLVSTGQMNKHERLNEQIFLFMFVH